MKKFLKNLLQQWSGAAECRDMQIQQRERVSDFDLRMRLLEGRIANKREAYEELLLWSARLEERIEILEELLKITTKYKKVPGALPHTLKTVYVDGEEYSTKQIPRPE